MFSLCGNVSGAKCSHLPVHPQLPTNNLMESSCSVFCCCCLIHFRRSVFLIQSPAVLHAADAGFRRSSNASASADLDEVEECEIVSNVPSTDEMQQEEKLDHHNNSSSHSSHITDMFSSSSLSSSAFYSSSSSFSSHSPHSSRKRIRLQSNIRDDCEEDPEGSDDDSFQPEPQKKRKRQRTSHTSADSASLTAASSVSSLSSSSSFSDSAVASRQIEQDDEALARALQAEEDRVAIDAHAHRTRLSSRAKFSSFPSSSSVSSRASASSSASISLVPLVMLMKMK